MRKRVLLLACALGAISVAAFSPQAHAAKCTSIRIGDHQTRCLEDVVCGIVDRVVPGLCALS
jgi:hypothetical protein